MTLKDTVFQKRKERILGIVINEYITKVTPVSSSYIARQYMADLSPATIRHILAELETDGYLTHPHTSAGRVPTQEGYRFYVDNLMNEISLLEEQKKKIRAEYERELQDFEEALEKTSRVISDLTHYTSIITIDGHRDRVFCKGTSYVIEYADYKDIHCIREILDTLERKERILEIINRQLEEKIKVYIGHEIACSAMNDCSLAISRYQTTQGITGRMAVLGPTRMDYQRVVSALNYLSKLMEEIF